MWLEDDLVGEFGEEGELSLLLLWLEDDLVGDFGEEGDLSLLKRLIAGRFSFVVFLWNDLADSKFQSKLDEQAKKINLLTKKSGYSFLQMSQKKEDVKQKLLLENKSYARKLEEYKIRKKQKKIGRKYREPKLKKYFTQLQNIQQIYDQKARLHKETINNMKKQLLNGNIN